MDRNGIVSLPGGAFFMGSDEFYPEERPVREADVDPFAIDRRPVTVAEFRRFVSETGYVTLAERPRTPGSIPTPTRSCSCPARWCSAHGGAGQPRRRAGVVELRTASTTHPPTGRAAGPTTHSAPHRSSCAARSRAAHTRAPTYCLRFRPAARQSETVDTSTSHIGFRCVIR